MLTYYRSIIIQSYYHGYSQFSMIWISCIIMLIQNLLRMIYSDFTSLKALVSVHVPKHKRTSTSFDGMRKWICPSSLTNYGKQRANLVTGLSLTDARDANQFIGVVNASENMIYQRWRPTQMVCMNACWKRMILRFGNFGTRLSIRCLYLYTCHCSLKLTYTLDWHYCSVFYLLFICCLREIKT